MNRGIKELLKLVPPPDHPVETAAASDWSRIEKEFGAKLPKDYKQFIDQYGTGEFANFFCIFNPFTAAAAIC